jgi:hypothetical protein
MVIRAAALALGALLAASEAAAQEIAAWVEPETVALGQTADLVVEAEAGGWLGQPGEPRLPEIPGVSIVGRSREARVVMTENGITRLSRYRFTLLPRAPGAIRIEPIRVAAGDRTLTTIPLVLLVVAAGEAPRLGREPGAPEGDGPPPVFAVTRVDRHRAWVGEQVTLTFAFYHDPAYPLAESPDYDPPETPGFWRVEIDKDPVVSLERLGSRGYHVQRFRYALFPLRAGELEIGPAEVRIVDPDRQRWWRPGRSRTIATEPLRVTVDPLPPAPPGFGGAVGRYELEGAVRPRRTAAGTPVELELTVRGTGNPSAVGAPMLPPWPDIEVRPPWVDARSSARVDGVSGEKTFRFLLVPESPGRVSLGAIQLPYFDPALGEYRVDSLRLGEIVVARGAAGQGTFARERAPTAPRLWAARFPRGARGDRGLAGEAWAWAALALPWAAWLLVVGARGALRKAPRDPARAPLKRLAAARRGLAGGSREPLEAAERALSAALAARYGASAVAAPPRDRNRALVVAGAPPALAAAAETARAALAAARYGGGSPAEAAAAIERLERLLGPRPRARGAALLALVALLAAAPVVAGPSDDRATARGAWEAANAAYRGGDFSRAIEGYEALLERWADARLEANLAAALWRQGSEGAAVAHYMHGLALEPRSGALRADLSRLRASMGGPPDARSPVARALGTVTLGELFALVAIGNVLAFAAFLVARRRARARPLFRMALVLLVGLATVAAIYARAVLGSSWGVTTEPAALLAAPDPASGAPIVASLPEGSVVRVLERGAAWRVRPEGRPAGWVARQRIVPVDSRGRSHAN